MFVGKDYLFLMCPKTGCMDTMARLKIADPDGKFQRVSPEGKHNGIWCVPHKVQKNKTILGGIRNPWAWYLSHWAHFCYKQVRGAEWARLSRREPRMAPLFADSMNVSNFREWLHLTLCDKARKFHPDYNRRGYSTQVGWYTHYYAQMYLREYPRITAYADLIHAECAVDYWIHTESIVKDLLMFFPRLSAEKINMVTKPAAHNTTKHPSIEAAYTEELVEIVRERDHLLIEKFKYEYR